MEELDRTSFPFIVLKVQERLFCVDSRHVEAIMQLPDYKPVPAAPPIITGVFIYRGETITMFDLRTALQMQSLEDEYGEFVGMLDARKQDHRRWVEELERCMKENEQFQLATDPHQCALGKWYDHFHSDSNEVNFHLRKLDEPHRRLHESAHEAMRCARNCESCQRDECLQKILSRNCEEYMPKILGILEEAKEIFRTTIFKEMVLVLNGDNRIGIVADEVLSVETLTETDDGTIFRMMQASEFLKRVMKSERHSEMLFELDTEKINAAFCPSDIA